MAGLCIVSLKEEAPGVHWRRVVSTNSNKDCVVEGRKRFSCLGSGLSVEVEGLLGMEA